MKRSIGIDISRDKVRVVQLGHSRGRLSLEQACVQQIPNSTSLNENSVTDLRTLIKAIMTQEGFDTHATATVAMPSDRVFFHSFRTELSKDEDVRRLLKFELEDDFPVPFDDLVADICSCRELKEHKRQFLVGAVSRSELRDWVKILTEAGVECSVVTADACALHTALAFSHDLAYKLPSIIIYADGSRTILAISENNRLVCVRNLNYQDVSVNEDNTSTVTASMLTREIELTWRAIFNSCSPVPTRILVSGNNELIQNLSEALTKETNYEIIILDPFVRIRCPAQQHVDSELTIALGLALMGANKNIDVLNFLAADALKEDQKVKTKQSALVFGVLLLAIGILLVGNLFIQLNTLESQRQSIKRQIRQVFIQTLPEEKRIVNELAQMTEQFERLKAEYSTFATAISNRTSPLRILQGISEKITPDENISVSNISINAESVRLSGTATSFESVDNVISMLHQIDEFDRVELQSTDIDPRSSRLRFSLLITMALKL